MFDIMLNVEEKLMMMNVVLSSPLYMFSFTCVASLSLAFSTSVSLSGHWRDKPIGIKLARLSFVSVSVSLCLSCCLSAD